MHANSSNPSNSQAEERMQDAATGAVPQHAHAITDTENGLAADTSSQQSDTHQSQPHTTHASPDTESLQASIDTEMSAPASEPEVASAMHPDLPAAIGTDPNSYASAPATDALASLGDSHTPLSSGISEHDFGITDTDGPEPLSSALQQPHPDTSEANEVITTHEATLASLQQESDPLPMSEIDAVGPETLEAMQTGPSWGSPPQWHDEFDIPERPLSPASAATPWVEPIQTVTDIVGTVQATGLRQRKPKTEEDYLRRVKFLMRKSSEMRTLDAEQPHVSSPIDVVEDLLHLAPRYTIHTWLLYRSALLWYLASNLNRHSEQANAVFSIAYKRLASTRAKPGARDPRTRIQTAATNMRGIPEADFLSLLQELSTNRRKAANWSSRAAIYLQAILAAGLRPGEWCTANWQDETKSSLQVVTLKTKETVAHLSGIALYEPTGVNPRPPNPDSGPRIRTVPVEPEDRLMVDLHLENIRRYLLGAAPGEDTAKRYKTYYEYCRRALDRVCRRLWEGKKSYSLYDGRHQFAANRKAEMSLEDVARLLGHESTRSTVIYASKVKAWSRRRGNAT